MDYQSSGYVSYKYLIDNLWINLMNLIYELNWSTSNQEVKWIIFLNRRVV